ncbi:hypothetical protein MHU86_21222 [Fragilaria crotonensis]|nr:hypothetical protein MHU86_21222 [Fragilaria crotonensis]
MTDGDSQEMTQVDYAISSHFVNAVRFDVGGTLLIKAGDEIVKAWVIGEARMMPRGSVGRIQMSNSEMPLKVPLTPFSKNPQNWTVSNYTRDEEIALKNAKNTVPVSMSQEIHLPEEPLIDAGHETEHTNTHLDDNDDILMESTSLETDCIDFGSRVFTMKTYPNWNVTMRTTALCQEQRN